MRWVVVSIVVHLGVLSMFVTEPRMYEWHVPVLPHVEMPPPTVVEIIELRKGGGGGGGRSTAARHAPRRSPDAWEQVAVSFEQGGQGQGQGQGQGDHLGSGFAAAAIVRVPDDIPTPPIVRISKARPARLIWPNRDEEVDDDANLFIATVTIDSHGDVVGARMRTVRPGAKADRAADAIWTFRYSPALDDDGKPVKSTLDQQFQVR